MTSTTDISLQALDVKNDRDVLIELFNLTDGGNWKRSDNWGSTLPLKHWWGVNADDSDNVIGINLAKNNLSGPLPKNICALSSLTQLHLRGNQLTGSLPASLGKLKSLERLFISQTKITGEIPVEVIELICRRDNGVGLNDGMLLPLNLGQLDPSITSLILSGKEIAGLIPPSIGKLTQLTVLDLSSNRLEGPIPIEMGRLVMLQELCLLGNSLTGFVPVAIRTSTRIYAIEVDEANREKSICQYPRDYCTIS